MLSGACVRSELVVARVQRTPAFRGQLCNAASNWAPSSRILERQQVGRAERLHPNR